MSDISQILFFAVIAATLTSCVVYIGFFITQKNSLRKTGRLVLILSGVLQTVYILYRYFETGHTPITTRHETAFFFAWATTWAYLTFRWRYTVKNFGTFVSIVILAILCAAAVASKDSIPLEPSLQSGWLPVHAGVSILAYGFLSLAFCGGIMYLLQERELKSKNFGYFFPRLPSLDALDQLNSHCLTAGFAFLTLGIMSGSIWAKQVWGTYWQWAPKEVWSMVTWFIYLIQIHQRFTVGWRGKRAAVMAIAGFAAAIFAYWGVTSLFEGVYSYGK